MPLDWRRILGLGSSVIDSTGLGPDIPSAAGDRERGKFRESSTPRLTVVAVSNDDGTPIITDAFVGVMTDLLDEVRKLRLALQMQGVAAELDDNEFENV
jgi:hypothetical protein